VLALPALALAFFWSGHGRVIPSASILQSAARAWRNW
jgi:hypothetical protein